MGEVNITREQRCQRKHASKAGKKRRVGDSGEMSER